MTNHRIRKPLLLTAILTLLLTQCVTTVKFIKASGSTQDPSGGFCGVYRNFPNGTVDFRQATPNPGNPDGVKTDLISGFLPWTPKSSAAPIIERSDWYEIPSCLVTIDPAVTGVTMYVLGIGTLTGTGLSFYMIDTTPGTGNWPAELNGGLPGDPYYFTVEWETRINVTQPAPVSPWTVAMESDDDSWLFVDNSLMIDLGGIHGAYTGSAIIPNGLHTITIYYAERYDVTADFKVAFSPAVTILDPSEICAKKSFEDLLRHQAESILSFEDLLRLLPPANRTSELFESLENLTEEQEGLLRSFGGMINASSLLPAEFISLLNSFEDLLHRQYDIKEGFMDMLNESKPYLPDFPTFLNSTENLLRSDDELLQSFEDLARNLFPPFIPGKTYTVDQQTYFLESYEHLLENQSQLLEKFEELIGDPPVTSKDTAINLGLAWLANLQDARVGSPTKGAWNIAGYPDSSNPGYYSVASTAFAVLKLEEYATKTLGLDPFSTAYPYSQNVLAGWKYIFGNAVVQNINTQTAGNPDKYPLGSSDSEGIYFISPGTDRPLYETGIVMMALEASCNPQFIVGVGPLTSWTYLSVMEDAVDYVSWAQNDPGNPGEGGWQYGAYNNGILVPPAHIYGTGLSDNSVSQWAVLGLMSAESWDIYAPAWVRSELDIWLGHSQYMGAGNYFGSFGYTGSSTEPNIALTAAGITELCYAYDGAILPSVSAAFGFIVSDWMGSITHSSGDALNIGNLYAMYGVMKACVMYGIVAPNGLWGGKISNSTTSIDWQTDYDTWLLANQASAGHWTTSPLFDGSKYEAEYHVLATEWALLILEKVAPQPTPSFKESFEDLLRRQADRIVSFENLLGNLPAWNRTSELFESLENLTEEQEGLLRSFGGMINASSLAPAEFTSLLNSSEDLLDRQYVIKEGFMDMLNDSKQYLQPNFSEFLSSVEDLLRSDAQLLTTFEDQVLSLFTLDNVTIDQKIHFLESYEQLLEDQSRLIGKFQKLSEDAAANVAVTNVDVSSTSVLSGDIVNINVSVQDTGDFAQTFNVTAYANSQVIGEQSVSLDSGSSTNIAFAWNTTGFGKGDYAVSASASVVPGEVNTADNTRFADNIVTILYLYHDVAVTNVTTSKTVVGQGYSLNTTVTAANQGDYTETFNVTAYADATIIGSENVTLPAGNSTTVTFTWNTTGFAYGNYTLSAYAWPVQGEIDTANNNCTDGWVIVSLVGDITGPNGWPDGKVDIRDISYVARHFGATPSSPRWDPNCDINDDDKIDIRDIGIVARHFGQHYP